ncbi:serine/threonine-protein kinase [Planctomycetes bacterium TBK1r]|uniref:Serine/threonine-protein kinase PknB n=1 Tax=Stieleria magnilauensis TaxID=2527963 RepID=A0ABX5Y267_9BACT|nr:Serine/threonine-protein kinase PknB [Planctomycetes bacterium TBK1r]
MNHDPTHVREDDEAEFRDPVEALGEELLERRRRGEQVTTDEYARAHPELADQIRLQFPVMIALEKFKENTLSATADPYDIEIDTPQELGDYHIIREIGRGAMGVVYEAEQQSLQRRVAVKVFPRQTLREARKLERFSRESKTAARLHHNNIVPVFGVGHHAGLHYFVMQRIDGIGLDEIIEQAKAQPQRDVSADDTHAWRLGSGSTADSGSNRSVRRARWFSHREGHLPDVAAEPESKAVDPGLGLEITSSFRRAANIGVQVADAIHYAHSQGVLHRDIKPSNLMIDPNGTVWVTDFGLATALQQDPSVDRNDIAGTLRFMAPEQLGGKHDTRSDLYSLGVTLYELITLQPAFVAGSKAAVVDRILRGEFQKPRDVRPRIPRDLEAIVLKAMALQPEQRYANGRELADDLTRFIKGRPVRARRIGGLGRMVRWARRDPLAASLVGTLAIVIGTSFVLVSSKWREAVEERHRAENNLIVALESMDQILGRFTSSWMARPTDLEPGPDDPAPGELQLLVSDHNASLMEDAIRFYDRFAVDNAPSPRLQRDTARVHKRAGDIYQRLGKYGKAERAYVRCLQILDQQDSGDDTSLVLIKAKVLNQLGLVKHATSRFVEAEQQFLKARDVLIAQVHPDQSSCQAELARTFSNLGQSQWLMFHHEDAKRSHRKAVSILETLVDREPNHLSYQLALARAYRAYYPFASDRNSDERTHVKSAGIAILDALVLEHPQVPDYQCELAEMLTATIRRSRRSDDAQEQIAQLQRGIKIARDLSDAYPAIPRYKVTLADALKTMGDLVDRSDSDAAISHLNEAVAIYRSLTSNFPDVPAYHFLCAMALREHAQTLFRIERFGESKASAEQAVEDLEAYTRLRSGNRMAWNMLARLHDQVAEASMAMHEADAAEAAWGNARQIREKWNLQWGL